MTQGQLILPGAGGMDYTTSSGPLQSHFSIIQWKGNLRDEETQQIRDDRGEKDKYNKKGRRDETQRSGIESKIKQFPLWHK